MSYSVFLGATRGFMSPCSFLRPPASHCPAVATPVGGRVIAQYWAGKEQQLGVGSCAVQGLQGGPHNRLLFRTRTVSAASQGAGTQLGWGCVVSSRTRSMLISSAAASSEHGFLPRTELRKPGTPGSGNREQKRVPRERSGQDGGTEARVASSGREEIGWCPASIHQEKHPAGPVI